MPRHAGTTGEIDATVAGRRQALAGPFFAALRVYRRIRSLPQYDITFRLTGYHFTMYLVAIAWIYVVVMMALAEGLSPQGSWLGACFTLLLYGALPLSVVMYILGTPARRRARRAAEAAGSIPQPDSGREPPGDALTTVRKEP